MAKFSSWNVFELRGAEGASKWFGVGIPIFGGAFRV